jgi:hexosaminidase
VYCAGNDSTLTFLKDVLTEVIELFPSKYIHIGGDECPKTRWKTCTLCQNRIKSEGLKDEHELQSWFVQHIEKWLNTRGRQIIGWDEILEGGLAPNATVMSWRGTAGGEDAAKQGHNVIMTPGKPCYFDHYQSKDSTEPIAIGGYNPLQAVYEYNPVPSSLNSKMAEHILGAQGNVWTEYMETEAHVEYMVWPRAAALAEALWTGTGRDYKKFLNNLPEAMNWLEVRGINHARHFSKKP